MHRPQFSNQLLPPPSTLVNHARTLRHMALNSPINSCPLPQLTPLNHYPSTSIFQSAPTTSLDYREDVVAFVNSYPNLEVSHELQWQEEYNSSTPLVLNITLTRDTDERDGDNSQTIISPLPREPQYPSTPIDMQSNLFSTSLSPEIQMKVMVMMAKSSFFLYLGNPGTHQLLSIQACA